MEDLEAQHCLLRTGSYHLEAALASLPCLLLSNGYSFESHALFIEPVTTGRQCQGGKDMANKTGNRLSGLEGRANKPANKEHTDSLKSISKTLQEIIGCSCFRVIRILLSRTRSDSKANSGEEQRPWHWKI